MSKEGLKPCEICKSEHVECCNPFGFFWHVECLECGNHVADVDRDCAVDTWNTRAGEQDG